MEWMDVLRFPTIRIQNQRRGETRGGEGEGKNETVEMCLRGWSWRWWWWWWWCWFWCLVIIIIMRYFVLYLCTAVPLDWAFVPWYRCTFCTWMAYLGYLRYICAGAGESRVFGAGDID